MIDGALTIFQSSRFFNDRGGAQSCFMALHRLLKNRGHRVIPMTGTHQENFQSEYSEYFVRRHSQDDVSTMRFVDKAKAALDSFYARDVKQNTQSIIDRFHPDIADIHNIYYQISPSVFGPLHKAGIPIIHHLHDYAMFCCNGVCETHEEICTRCRGKRYYNALKYRCYHNSMLRSLIGVGSKIFNNTFGTYNPKISRYIVTSQFQKDFLVSWGLNPEKMEVLPLFFDWQNYPDLDLRDESDEIMFFGEMKVRKGPHLVYKLAKRIPNVRFVFAGRGPLGRVLSDQAALEKVHNVEFYDYLPKEQLFQRLSRSLLTIMPSIFLESFGRVIIESNYYCRPVVGSAVGALPEVIQNGETGYIFRLGDVNDLYEKVIYLLNNPSLRHAMGEKARSLVLERYSSDRYYQNLMKIYEATLEH